MHLTLPCPSLTPPADVLSARPNLLSPMSPGALFQTDTIPVRLNGQGLWEAGPQGSFTALASQVPPEGVVVDETKTSAPGACCACNAAGCAFRCWEGSETCMVAAGRAGQA